MTPAAVGGWQSIASTAVSVRRALHRRPELAWSESATATTVRSWLDDLGLPWRACAGTGTVAVLAPDAPGRHVALRADMDAMPIAEQSGLEWTSQHDGVMHACGHDGHMATLLAVASWLRDHEDALPGPVTLLFQPAEEGGHGARYMIEDGALDGGPLGRAPSVRESASPGPVDVIFGWHNWPAIPFGQAVCPDGAVMSANGTFRIEVIGRGGHASQPEAARDPVLAASAITLALQQIVSRRIPAQEAAVVAVTSFDAQSVETVTPDRAVLAGSIRVGNTAQRDRVLALIAEIAADIAGGYGVRAVTESTPRYDATINHPGPAADMRGALEAVLGEGWLSDSTIPPIMASEDFSYYLKEIPGAFALVGADDGHGHDEPCHSARYRFNEALIPVMSRVYARIAGVPISGEGEGDNETGDTESSTPTAHVRRPSRHLLEGQS